MTATADRIDLALDKALAERSLHEFFRQSWHVTTPGADLCDGWHLQAIAAHLEAVIAGLIQDLLILVPPRCGKTLLTSVCLPAWAWIRKPELQFLCASYGQDLSQRLLCRLSEAHALDLVPAALGGSLAIRGRRESSHRSEEQLERVAHGDIR